MHISPAHPRYLSLFRRCLALLIIGVAIGTAACLGSESKNSLPQSTNEPVTRNSKNPLTDLLSAASAGNPLYAANCGMCHGDSGKGDGAAGTALAAKPTDLTVGDVTKNPDGELFLVIKNGKMTNGKMVMPPVKQVTDQQIWQIVAYVRTLSQQ